MVFRFGQHELDDSARELRRGGQSVPIEPKVFDLLNLLVRHPRRALTRDLILREVWPGIKVGECSLGRLVKEARRALGDDGTAQSMIRTVRGVGYRFEAEVRTDSNPDVRVESDRLIARAREALEIALDREAMELRARVDEFVHTCQVVLDRAYETR